MKKLLLFAAVAILATACTKDDDYFPVEPETPVVTEVPSESNNFNQNKYFILFKEGRFLIKHAQTHVAKDFFHTEAEALIRDSIYVIPADAPYTYKPEEGLRFQKEMLRK